MENLTFAQRIREDEAVSLSYDRVDKLPSPLLVIGLGGTGKDAVRTIKSIFAQRFVLPKTDDGQAIPVPARTAYLVIDSDQAANEAFDKSELVDITTTGLDDILRSQGSGLTPDEKLWVNKNLDASSVGKGAGTYRTAARLMLNRQYASVKNAIQSAMTKICLETMGETDKLGRLEVALITGIGGGTGSGTFLDIAQIIHYVKETTPILNKKFMNLTGYIIMPDVTLAHVHTAAMEIPIKRNSFAALKELDFWMNYENHRTVYTMKYAGMDSVTWQTPFDHCVLMSGSSVTGSGFDNAYEAIQQSIAENLLHYLAQEDMTTNKKTGAGDAVYSFMSFEDNLNSMLGGLAGNHPLPMEYKYRAIGAYSKRIPKKKILYYEGSILFKTFIPLKNERGTHEPNDALLKDGQTKTRAAQLTGSLGNFYNNFRSAVKTPPAFGQFNPQDETRLKVMRSMNPRPHAAYDCNPLNWQSNVVRVQAAMSAEGENGYLDKAWAGFQAYCMTVMSDPKLGPFSLYQYLTDRQNGLLTELDAIAKQWRQHPTNIRNSLNAFYQACEKQYPAFVRPPLLNGGKAVAEYLNSLQSLYDNIRQLEFAEAYSKALDIFIARIHKYVEDALKPLVETLIELEKEFVAPDVAKDDLGSDLFTVASVAPTVDTIFTQENAEDWKVTRAFLSELCTASFESERNVDKQSCGLNFIFPNKARLNVLTVLRTEMNRCFKQVNEQSLDAIMIQSGITTPEAQKKWIQDLGDSVKRSASPLFSLDSGIGNERYAICDYLSVPQDSEKCIRTLKELYDGDSTTVKSSTLLDHIYCTTAWDGIPLYIYSEMASLEEAYENACLDPVQSKGLHLVWTGDANAEYTANWCRLPSPKPFYFFGAHGTPKNEKEYDDVKALVKRAMDASMLSIDTTLPTPRFTFRRFANGPILTHNSVIADQVKEILERKDPISGQKLNPEQLTAALEALRAGAAEINVETGKNPVIMSKKLGLDLTTAKVNPFDPIVQANPVFLKEARANFDNLSVEMAVAVVEANPALHAQLVDQVEAFEMIAVELNKLRDQTKVWDPRIAYADTFAELISYGVLDYTRTGALVYKDAMEQNAPLVNPGLLADDLKMIASRHILGCSYIADLHVNNETRQFLEFVLNNTKQEWTAKDTMGTLTDADVDQKIARLDKLIAGVNAEIMTLTATKTKDPNADVATINKCISLLNGIKVKATNERVLLG